MFDIFVNISPRTQKAYAPGFTSEPLVNGQQNMEKMAFPADPAPDIINHQPAADVDKALILKELEAREQQRRAGLARRGSTNGRTRLHEWDVALIRSMYGVWGLSVSQLAVRWSLPRETVRDVVKRRTWTHI